MPEVVGIRFKPCGKIYSFDINSIAIKPGMWIVVLSEMGLSLGLVVKAKHNVKQSDQQFKKILRIATVQDLEADRNNQTLEDEARSFWIEKVKSLNLPMKVIGTEATLDRKRLVFYFTAEGRIDFRELVRDLASKFKTRIEMRQIGVRDEVKFIGGIGCCGREVCCRVFLTSFEPISIRMAKKQELVLNPGKLSGICGRLMCCLGYEIGASPQKSFKEKILSAETKDRDMTVTVSSIDKVSCPDKVADSLSDKEKNLPQHHSDAPAEPKPKEKQEKPYIPKRKDKGRDRGKPFSKRKKFWKKKRNSMNKFYVTTPIYYVNDVPHIGHAYTTIAADIVARYSRLTGKEVFFLTGTDEHGQKVEKAALEKGRSPKEHSDLMTENFKNLWIKLNISNNAFIRTTDTEHIKTVQGLLQMLWDRGEIEKRDYSGWYCTPDERFWMEKEIIDGNCPDCGRPVENIQEENYFFLMSKYHKNLIGYIKKNPSYILPETRRNEVLGFLENNTLGDLCISRPRARLSWGISIPFDKDFVTYVWFDALVNYFSATRYLVPGAEKARLGDFWWPADYHIVGKDILTTHAVYWSTMLMALNLPLPGHIFTHGWWTVRGKKMSKSLGNVIDPNEMIEKYGTDAFRYFLFREVPFGLDGDFSEDALITRFNTDLANDLGNLLSRSLTMIEKYKGGIVPEPVCSKEKGMEKRIQAHFTGESIVGGPAITLHNNFDFYLSKLEFGHALSILWNAINFVNKYIEDSTPWKEKDKEMLSTILYTLAESLRLIAVYIFSFMPSAGEEIWRQLGINASIEKTILSNPKFRDWGGYTLAGTKTAKGKALFPRIDLIPR